MWYVFQIAKQHNVPFLETSAKSNINVEKAFMDLTQAILNKVLY
jgi:Ras-related protein Rab-10